MRKTATRKQPARLTAHHILPLEGHTRALRRTPFSDQNALPPAGAAAASASGSWRRGGWTVAGQQVGGVSRATGGGVLLPVAADGWWLVGALAGFGLPGGKTAQRGCDELTTLRQWASLRVKAASAGGGWCCGLVLGGRRPAGGGFSRVTAGGWWDELERYGSG